MEYFNNVKVDDSHDVFLANVQLLDYGVCPKCKKNKLDMINNGLLDYSKFVGIIGVRGGKTVLIASLVLYITHIQLVNKIIPVEDAIFTTSLHMSCRHTARIVMFDPMVELMNSNSWFNDYHSKLSSDDYKIGYDSILYKDVLKIEIDTFDRHRLRGKFRNLVVTDSLKLNNQNESNIIYRSLNESLTTYRSLHRKLYEQGSFHIPNGLFINIGQPDNDYLQNLIYNKSDDTYSVVLPPWEVNPLIDKIN
jgi:hypothetical protein